MWHSALRIENVPSHGQSGMVTVFPLSIGTFFVPLQIGPRIDPIKSRAMIMASKVRYVINFKTNRKKFELLSSTVMERSNTRKVSNKGENRSNGPHSVFGEGGRVRVKHSLFNRVRL